MYQTNNNFHNILKHDNMLKQFAIIKKNSRNKKMVYNFKLYLNTNIQDILEKLYTDKYKFKKYRIFIIKDPKYRIIMSEDIEDKLVNHLVSNHILLPNLEKRLIDTNVATRFGKGSSYAFNVLVKYINTLSLEKKEIYVLKIDMKKYFYNIDHDILIKKLSKYIKDQNSLKIVEEIINSTNEPYLNKEINKLKKIEVDYVNKLNISDREKEIKINSIKDLPIYKHGKGLPIGNMTSQILAIFYLNDVDHYIKENLKCKHYIRYMDDLIILDHDYKNLKKCFDLIREKIYDHKLETNNKSNIHKLSAGFTFIGYTFRNDYNGLSIKCANQTVYKIHKNLRNLKEKDPDKYNRSLGSYQGYFKYSDKKLKFKKIVTMY